MDRLELRCCVVWISWLCCLSTASVITMTDNGYSGIMVAIKDTVPEDDQIVPHIQELFTNASRFLYTATRGRAYFKNITIAIPSTWSNKPNYEPLPGNFFSNAHVRVDDPNPEYGDSPYTLQPGGCGEPGQYIHLTPWFIKELKGKTMEMFGAPERQLIHEWAHLRYGVFDEYGIPGDRRYPMFYFENRKIRPTSCIRDIRGWIESRDGGPCSITQSGEVDSDCIFVPDMNSEAAKASIMYMPFIPSMEGFCDEDSDRKHNMRAPTKHNTVCNYESTWRVISRHKDFQQTRVTRQAPEEARDPAFRLVQPPKNQEGCFVLVLDVSGSMNGRPIKLLHRAATRMVEGRIPDGAYLGIVKFSTTAETLHGLTRVDNSTRLELSASLPSEDDGGRTAIGKGILEAMKVLKEGGIPPEGGLILLITDGEENVTPFIHEVLPDVLEQKVIINTVAFGPDASAKLENVTIATGGKGYFLADIHGSRPSTALDSAFLESVTSQADVEMQPVQLKDDMFSLHEAVTKKRVRIEKELGKNTIFIVISSTIERVEVTLRSPSGVKYDKNSPEYSKDDSLKQRIQIILPQAETGKWSITFHRIGDYSIPVALSVTSEPKDIRQQPIRVRSWLSDMQLNSPAYAKIYAEVKKQNRAVVKATVVATVDRPMGEPVDVELRDDGMGADRTKNDGIYTGYFTRFNGNGRYAVLSRVVNDGQARLKNGSRASGALPIPRTKGHPTKDPSESFSPEEFLLSQKNLTYDDDEDEKLLGEPAEEFDRSADSGAFRLEGWIPNAGDVIPPGDVMDLLVLSTVTSGNYSTVTLQWTSPGDDLYSEQVSSVELRSSPTMEDLLYRFNEAFLYDSSLIANGSLTPEPPGHRQRITVMVPEHLRETDNASDSWSLYFAVKGADNSSNLSEKHNIATANFFVRNSLRNERMEQKLQVEGTESDSSQEESSHSSTFKWWPIGLGIGIVIVLIVLGLMVTMFIVKSKKKKSYSSVSKG